MKFSIVTILSVVTLALSVPVEKKYQDAIIKKNIYSNLDKVFDEIPVVIKRELEPIYGKRQLTKREEDEEKVLLKAKMILNDLALQAKMGNSVPEFSRFKNMQLPSWQDLGYPNGIEDVTKTEFEPKIELDLLDPLDQVEYIFIEITRKIRAVAAKEDSSKRKVTADSCDHVMNMVESKKEQIGRYIDSFQEPGLLTVSKLHAQSSLDEAMEELSNGLNQLVHSGDMEFIKSASKVFNDLNIMISSELRTVTSSLYPKK